MPFIKITFNTLSKLIKNRSIKDMSFAKFKEDYLKRWNDSDSFEKFAGIGFSLFVIIIAIFIPDEEQQKYSKFITLFGIIMLVAMAERAKKAKKNVIEKNIEIEKQKHIVEEKNKEILDSIEYALRIQTAILPPQKIVKQYLVNSFILYKPKDIVAGDFYWMESVDDLVLFAACCNNALNRVVREFKLTQPAAILDKTLELVIDHFSKSEEDIKDGMDISLCALNLKTKKLEWAGANNPLWLIQNGELIETKADKQPIGKNDNVKLFTNHSYTLNNGDAMYIFSDGFADQFGGETGQKKLTRKRFKELILGIQEKSMEDQCNILDNFIVNYRNQIEQIDDILVMGVKI